MNIENIGGRDQSQVKIKFKKFEKSKSVPKDVPKCHNDDSNAFTNIANCGILRAQINAIKAKIPELEQEPTLPRGSFPFGDGYALLWATDSMRHLVSSREAEAIHASRILDNSNQSQDPVEVLRWARLLLPNGQVSRCAWKEKSGGEKVVRCARNVKVLSA